MSETLISREKVEEALDMLGKPGDGAEARVWIVARAYIEGRLVLLSSVEDIVGGEPAWPRPGAVRRKTILDKIRRLTDG